MKVSIYHRRRFYSDVIKRVIWLYFRFNLSLHEIEELMAKRGVDVSYETIRRWIEQFGPVFAKRIKARSPLIPLSLESLSMPSVSAAAWLSPIRIYWGGVSLASIVQCLPDFSCLWHFAILALLSCAVIIRASSYVLDGRPCLVKI